MGLYFYAAPMAPGTVNAYHSKGDKKGAVIQNVATIVDASALRGHHWRLGPNDFGQGSLVWPGGYNIPGGTQRSYVMRFRTAYTGAPDPACGLFSILGPGIYLRWYTMSLFHTGSNISLCYWGSSGNTGADNTTIGAFSPVANTAYDLVVVQDDSLVFGNLKIYIDGVLIGTLDTNARWTDFDPHHIGLMAIGECGVFVLNTNIKVEEFAVFEGIVDHTVFTGAARTQPITATAFDGITWPAQNKVDSTAPAWNQFGTPTTGILVVPGESIDPIDTNVLVDVPYKINGVSKTGKLKPGVNYTTLRGFYNYILDFIGAESLTDAEYATIDDLDNPDFDWTGDTYAALASVLNGRSSGSGDVQELQYLFLSKSVAIVPLADDGSGILIGGDLETAADPDAKTNILIGGVIED